MKLVKEATVSLDQQQEDGAIAGYAATWDLDRDGDRIVKGAFREDVGTSVPLLWQHRRDEPIGRANILREDDRGLYFEGRIVTSTSRGRDAYELLKSGVIDRLSVGILVDPSDVEYVSGSAGRSARFIRRAKLLEVSVVTIPANEEARITAVKAVPEYRDWPLAERDRPWDADAAVRRWREWSGSAEEPSERYRYGFFWYDEEEPALFGSYKLPFVDVIDGRPHAVPRGIFAAAAVLRGARGGADIPEDDVPRVRAHISRYYEKMRRVFEDDSIVPPWERKDFVAPELEALAKGLETPRQAEALFRDLGFSRREAKALAAALRELRWREAGAGQRDADDDVAKELRRLLSVLKGET